MSLSYSTVLAYFLQLSVLLFACHGCGEATPTTETTPSPLISPEQPGQVVQETETTPPSTSTPVNSRWAPVRATRPRRVGTNLATARYWSANYPFVDLMHAADRWLSGDDEEWDNHADLDVDAQGWLRRLAPGQIARVFLLGTDNSHPTGTVRVRYEGEGTIEYNGNIRDLEQSQTNVGGTASFELDLGGLFLNITSINPERPLRNLRVFLPGGRCDSDVMQSCQSNSECSGACVPFSDSPEMIFHPVFLQEMSTYSVLRFMDWQETNRGPTDETPSPEAWSELPAYDAAFWHPVPVDVMVDLANLLGADPWLSMPAAASDALVTQFAARVAETLNEDRKVYIEYTNEYWNNVFGQHQWINGQGCAQAGGQDCDPDGNGVLCEYTAWNALQQRCAQHGRRYFAQRTVKIGALWRAAFRARSPERVIRVLGAQIGGAGWWIPDMLLQEFSGEPAHMGIDVVAVAPYFGGELRTARSLGAVFRTSSGTPRLLGVNGQDDGGVFGRVRSDLAALAELDDAELGYIAYEGGQHLHTHDEASMRILIEANSDSRMGELYEQYLARWAALTGDALFTHYSSPSRWNQYGAWGSAPRQGAPASASPKRQALLRFVQRR